MPHDPDTRRRRALVSLPAAGTLTTLFRDAALTVQPRGADSPGSRGQIPPPERSGMSQSFRSAVLHAWQAARTCARSSRIKEVVLPGFSP